MTEFQPKAIAILGRQPALGVAELESLFGAERIQPLGENALLSIDAADIPFRRLGGSLKIARVLTILPTTSWSDIEKYLVEKIPEHLANVDPGKFTLGVSAYGLATDTEAINRTNLKIKKAVRNQGGRPIRVVPNKEVELNTAQVLHNKLTSRGAWELILVSDRQQTYLAQTFFVQDIEAYAGRDQARPARDSRVGMLPPKLAQMIINLAIGKIDESPVASQETSDKKLEAAKTSILLDPFCGTGVILQEALLMGYQAIGTDLEDRMIEYSQKNLDWLAAIYNLPTTNFQLNIGDATNFQWSEPIKFVASETYLGRPFTSLPTGDVLHGNIQDCNTIIKKFLSNIGRQISSSTRLCLAVPAWRVGNLFHHLPLLDQLTDLGYNRVSFVHAKNEDLVYFREDQIVARELVILEKI